MVMNHDAFYPVLCCDPPPTVSSSTAPSVTWDGVEMEDELKELLRTVLRLKPIIAWRMDKLLGWVRCLV